MLSFMRNSFLLGLVMLGGCTVDNGDSCDTQYDYPAELVLSHGLVLQPSQQLYVTAEQVSAIYEDTMACLGLTASGPAVAFKSFTEQYIGGGWGIYLREGDLIWINTDNSVTFPRSCSTDTETLKHEFIHHILHANGLHDESYGHDNSMFRCGLGVELHN